MTVSRSLKTRSLPILTAAAMIATMIAVVAAPASAAVFSVTKTDDTADGTCDGDCSLREAINAANAAAGADTVTLPSGTYLLTIDGTDEDAGMAGDLDVTDDLTVTGAGAATTIVDASGLDEPVDRVFDLLNLDTTLTVAMSGLTIVNGNLEGSFNTTDDGGGIRVNGSDVSLSLTNSVVRDNSVDAGAAGGGIFLTGNDDTLTLMNTDVTMNFAQRGGGIKANGQGNIINVFGGSMVSGNEAGSGGGIFLLTDETTLTIDDSEVSHNEATGEGGSGDGGGIYIHHSRDGNTVILRNGSVLNENQADGDGGGLRVRENDAFTLDVLDSEVIGNTAYTGAGLYVGGGEGSTEAVATLDNSRVAFNRTDGDCGNGGGIYANAFPPEEGPEYGLTIENGSSVDRNFSACEGGGIYNGSQGSIGIFDSTVGHNVSWDEGGGIYNESGGLIEALDAAIELNSTLHGYGGGIYNEGRMWLYDETQISGNSAPEGHGGGIYNGGDVEGAFLFLGPESEEPDPEDVGPTVFANNADGAGGGIFNAPGSDLLMFRTAVLGNTAISGQYEGGVGSGGGGIYNHGWLWLDGSIVGFNRAANGPGGGLWNDGDGGPMDGAAEVDASLFLGNYASGDGGGIQNDSLVEGLGLHCSSVLGNSGWNGGGIGNTGQLSVTDCRPVALAIQRQMRRTVRAFQAQPDGPPVVEEIGEVLAGFDLFGESSVVGNVARNDGGGIWNTDAAEVFETTVDANSAPAGRGGGIFNSGRTGFTEWAYGTPGLFVDASTISDNFAQVSGGGLHTAVPGESGLRNSTVSGNFTNGEGGGIFEEDAGDSTVIFFTTVTGNSAPDFDGGGISIDDGDGSVGAVASIVGNNLGGDCSDTIESRGSNLDSDGSCFDSPEEFGDATADPELGPLADNGGLTETHLPDPGSPVVDGVGPIEGTCPEVDQRGEDRPVDGDGDEDDDCDIGSVELQEDELPPPPAPRVASAAIGVTTTADDPFVDDDDECSLRGAIEAANTDGNAHDNDCTAGSNPDTVTVPAGFYLLTQGDIAITDDLVIEGVVDGDGFISSVIDGDQNDRVFDIDGATVTMRDLVAQNGWIEGDGGGIRSRGDLTLDNVVVQYNRADCDGGGIWSSGPLALTNGSSVEQNGADLEPECGVGSGGGIYSSGENASVLLEPGTSVVQNNAQYAGGGIYNAGTGADPALVVDGGFVGGNVLTQQPDTFAGGGGGGIYNETTASLGGGATVAGNATAAGHGGGIYNGGTSAATLDVDESLIGVNWADFGWGGGVYSYGGSSVTLADAILAGNVAWGGGGVYYEGDYGGMTGFDSTDSVFLLNAAIGGPGGGLWNAGSGGQAYVTGGAFVGNVATYTTSCECDPEPGGGAIQNDSNGEESVPVGEETAGLAVEDALIAANTATSAAGGGINNNGTAYVDGSELVDNVAAGGESGIDSFHGGGGGAANRHVLFVERSVVEDNVAADGEGGGLLNQEVALNQTLHVIESTVSGNVAAGFGGGGGAFNAFGTLDVLNVTLSGNFAARGSGGAITERGENVQTTHLRNATVAYNSAPIGGGGGVSWGDGSVDALNTIVGPNYGGDCDTLLDSLGYNLDTDGSCFDGGTDVHADPVLGPLQVNPPGAPLPTHALLPGSPAIDGVGAGCPPPGIDERGLPRPGGPRCDIGAYEVQPAPPGGGGGPPPPECSDGTDNDGDGEVDFPDDPGCDNSQDDDEENPEPPPACDDGVDNDGDGLADFPEDPGCASPEDEDEADLPPGDVCVAPGAIVGTDQRDVLIGDDLDNVLCGRAEDDVLRGGAGDDLILGEEGDDLMNGGPGDDDLQGGPGSDTADYSDNPTPVNADLNTGIVEGASTDTVTDVENLIGSRFDDTLRGDDEANILLGRAGRDTIRGRGGNDTEAGGKGADNIKGGDGEDVVRGNKGPDDLRGNKDDDTIRGGKGKDRMFGRVGDDTIRGGPGNDLLKGNGGDDDLRGNKDDDRLNGQPGTDTCKGGGGVDVLISCEA